MGRSLDGNDAYSNAADIELPEHAAYVSDFYLDTFEVTVARFRPFVFAFPNSIPKDGDGAHPKNSETGWHADWFQKMPQTREELEAKLKCPNESPPPYLNLGPTYSPEPGPRDNFPINCVSWYELFAFCVWEGGRLPTEAEWEYAATGGDENRLYPWGPAPGWPQLDDSYACKGPDCVGQHGTLAGGGRWGNFDLAGSMWDVVLDTVTKYTMTACLDCVVFDGQKPEFNVRGGSWGDTNETALRAAWRQPIGLEAFPLTRSSILGVRCARSL